jgi:hypothetical protein
MVPFAFVLIFYSLDELRNNVLLEILSALNALILKNSAMLKGEMWVLFSSK